MNTRLFLFFIILLPLLVACGGDGVTVNPSQIALDDSKLQFVSIENIGGSRDVTGLLEVNITPPINREVRDRTYPQTSTISPDGERIIFQRDVSDTTMICVYQFATNASTCTDVGERIPSFEGGFWSPDGRYFVLNMDRVGLQLLRDVDILIYDTQDNRLINRTDDGVNYDDRIFGDDSDEIRAKIRMDGTPTWSPNGDLYFFRNAIDPSVDEWRADLMRIPASDITGTSAPEIILRHPSDRAFPVYRGRGERLDGAMSISPNGQYLAYSALTVGGNDDTNNGIWIIDLAQQSVKIHIGYERIPFIMAGVPAWWLERVNRGLGGSAPPLMARSLSWSDDSNRLVILLDNPVGIPVPVPPIKYDVAANSLESWYDFTNIGEDDDVRAITLFGDVLLSADQNQPMAITSPTHKTIFYLGRNGVDIILSAMSISETGFVTPRRIVSSLEDVNYDIFTTSIGYSNGTVRILAGGNLITLREE